MALRISEERLREACAKLKSILATGATDKEACDALQMSWKNYEELKAKMYAQEVEALNNRTTEQVYIDYQISQRKNIEDLDSLIEHYKTIKQHSALVSAIKAKSEIADKIIAKGQEFGFIEKKPERKEIVAGLMVTQLSDKELKGAITGIAGGLDKLMKKYGDTSSILDLEPGPVHYSLPEATVLPIEADGSVAKAKNKVHKGRRAKREKV